MTRIRAASTMTVALLAALLMGGCARPAPTSPVPAAATSGIQGQATVDAGCPTMRPGTTCPRRPIVARLTITSTDGSGAPVASTVTDAQGRFRIPLPPGTYTLHPQNTDGQVVPIAGDQSIAVTTGFTAVEIPFDSGVR